MNQAAARVYSSQPQADKTKCVGLECILKRECDLIEKTEVCQVKKKEEKRHLNRWRRMSRGKSSKCLES